MPVESLKLKDFTAFREATLELAPGINVFIGENATGKTHAMKVAYAALRAMADRKTSPSRFDVLLRDSPENEHPV